MSPTTTNARNVPLPTTLPRRAPLVQFAPEPDALLPPPSSPLFMDASDSIATLERRPLDAAAAARVLEAEAAPRSATVKVAQTRPKADATEEVTLDDVLEISAAPEPPVAAPASVAPASVAPAPAFVAPSPAPLHAPPARPDATLPLAALAPSTPSFAPLALGPITGAEPVLAPLRPSPRPRRALAAAAVLAGAFASGLAAWLLLVPSGAGAPLKVEARSPSVANAAVADEPVERFAPARMSEPMPTAKTPVSVEDLPKRGADKDHGLLVFPKELRAHRVYVDGALAGHADEPVRARCGRRHVRVGTGGRAKVVDVPCGGELAIPR